MNTISKNKKEEALRPGFTKTAYNANTTMLNNPTQPVGSTIRPWAAMALLFICAASPALAAPGTFNSGSTGSDGTLSFTTPGTYDFDPDALGLDPDKDRVFHFTNVTIGSNVKLKFRANFMGDKPVVWLVSGNVTIGGILDLDGERGPDWNKPQIRAVPGPGGFRGGLGQVGQYAATNGEGPGGGKSIAIADTRIGGGGAGHVTAGASGFKAIASSTYSVAGGSAYGNDYLIPLMGGSGGGGGYWSGGGGGAGGGALLIACSGKIQFDGHIWANGGEGGSGSDYSAGGAGSGGSVRLVATTIAGPGQIRARTYGSNWLETSGGQGLGGASYGRIRMETYNNNYTGQSYPVPIYATPTVLFPPVESLPQVKVTSVNGVAVPQNPMGLFTPADLQINESGEVSFNIEAKNIPLGTVIHLVMNSETKGASSFDSTPLTGSFENSTATASTAIPPGFARFTIQANW